MQKTIFVTILMILAGAISLSAQILKPSVTINRDRTNIIQRLPGKIQSIAAQIRLPQPDTANKNTASSGHSLSSNFTLSPEDLKVDGKGHIDFIGALLLTATGSMLNIWGAPIAILDAAGNTSNSLPLGANGVALTVTNSQAGSLYLVDCGTYGATSLVVNTGQPQTVTPNGSGHVYFVLTAGSNDDVVATISSPNGMWAFFSCEISKLN